MGVFKPRGVYMRSPDSDHASSSKNSPTSREMAQTHRKISYCEMAPFATS